MLLRKCTIAQVIIQNDIKSRCNEQKQFERKNGLISDNLQNQIFEFDKFRIGMITQLYFIK